MSLAKWKSRKYKRINLENVKVQPSDVDDSFLNLMHEKAGGIPMYLTSITAWLIERDLIMKEYGAKVKMKGKIEDVEFRQM